MSFRLTAKQESAQAIVAGIGTHHMLFGGSRSGKTFQALRIIAVRALCAAGSRHAVLRFRFNHVKASIVLDTFPKMMALCFPDVGYHLDKSDWYVTFPNGSQIWFGGLDEKERTEKILGQEYATIFPNECSQIPWSSINIARTRLAQRVEYSVDGGKRSGLLRPKMIYDCNPPGMGHWSYKVFIQKIDPETNKPLADPDEYSALLMNPEDNRENLTPQYLKELDNLPARMRARFKEGKFADNTIGALWTLEMIDTWRTIAELPDMQRIVVAVDPSGAGDSDNADNDAIGICVAGLGVDGFAYVLEDLTCKAGPKVWGNIATTAFDRHEADIVVGETNYGGAMVQYVIKTSRPNTPFKMLTASRGKVVRAEPISALTEQGKIRFAGNFTELENELCSFTTAGYTGGSSPNRADAFVWAMSELFPGIVADRTKKKAKVDMTIRPGAMSRMATGSGSAWR